MFKLDQNYVYVKVYANRFELHDIKTARHIRVDAIPNFTTARQLIGDYSVAENTLREGMKKLYTKRLFAPSPLMVIQPMEKTKGGLSEVEERVLHELGFSAGARKTVVWIGNKLTNREVIHKFKGDYKSKQID